ncbi:MAG: hypothetical protein MUF54_05210 [Polyangiaceae bacterium]|jgi:hypothetical protein|nr:hypothetical protein [Polyangiaceae bacterium]
MHKTLLLAACLAAACSSSEKRTQPTPERPVDMTLARVDPPLLLPGTELVAQGAGFVPETVGTGRLMLRGDHAGKRVDLALPIRYVNDREVVANWREASVLGIEERGTFAADVWVEIDQDDGRTHTTSPLQVVFDVRGSLTPEIRTVAQGAIYVNHEIEIQGSGFLLGGEEGETVAVVDGCFRPDGATTCATIETEQVAAAPATRFDRTRVRFPFVPQIAGIRPGAFEGTVRVSNRHGPAAQSAVFDTAALQASYEIRPTVIHGFSTREASLGQYVDVDGGGFIGSPPGQSEPGRPVTLLRLEGRFLAAGSPDQMQVDVTLVPEFVSGTRVRYLLSEEDELGKGLDLRKAVGEFSGTIKPILKHEATTIEGAAMKDGFSIQHVRQIVWVNFQHAYVGSLRHFGLRAVDQLVRNRIFDIAKRDYPGVNIEFRSDAPRDFALYSQVDIGGPDPNGFGLLGYDNTPGKDVDNKRLYDKIGGVNARTQADGYPGYGGVFVESLFAFSEHPNSLAKKIDGANPAFDAIFDPFRPDVGGTPVMASELASVPKLTNGEGCPADASDRPKQIACAAFVLGSMIGSTTTHEVGHSLGLADPYGSDVHNAGDEVNRLMDSGQNRPFLERAELLGSGPSVFCADDYEYLRSILPTNTPDPVESRPSCW